MGAHGSRTTIGRTLGIAGAIALGLCIGSFPFLQYRAHGGHGATPHGATPYSATPYSATPHSNHASLYGGLLSMVGDHHLELAVTRSRFEVHVSDALRRPIAAASGTLQFDDKPILPLAWEQYRLLTQPTDPGAILSNSLTVVIKIRLPNDELLETEFSGGALATLVAKQRAF